MLLHAVWSMGTNSSPWSQDHTRPVQDMRPDAEIQHVSPPEQSPGTCRGCAHADRSGHARAQHPCPCPWEREGHSLWAWGAPHGSWGCPCALWGTLAAPWWDLSCLAAAWAAPRKPAHLPTSVRSIASLACCRWQHCVCIRQVSASDSCGSCVGCCISWPDCPS